MEALVTFPDPETGAGGETSPDAIVAAANVVPEQCLAAWAGDAGTAVQRARGAVQQVRMHWDVDLAGPQVPSLALDAQGPPRPGPGRPADGARLWALRRRAGSERRAVRTGRRGWTDPRIAGWTLA